MGKPAFNPNQPFEKTGGGAEKPAFDPGQPFQSLSESMPVQSQAKATESLGAGLWRNGFAGFDEAAKSQAAYHEALAEAGRNYQSPGGDSLSARISDPERWKAILGLPSKASQGAYKVDVPIVLPASAAPAALMKVAGALEKSAPLRVAANTGIGAAHGAVQDPGEEGSRAMNSALAALIAGGVAGGGEILAKAIPFAGGKLMNLKKADAEAYAKNPKLAERTYARHQNDPEGLNQELRDQMRGILRGEGSIFKQKSAPLLQKRGEMLVGKNVEIDPSQFKGTAAEQELKRIWNAQGKTIEVPLLERVRSAQVEPMVLETGPGKVQTIELPSAGAKGFKNQIKVPVQEQISETWAPQINLDDSFIPLGSQGIPAPMPDSISITGAQAQRMKKILQDAAKYNEKQYALGLAPKNETDAIAGSALRKAIEGVSPGVENVNAQLGRHATMQEAAETLFGSNPSRILNNSESIGNTNVRALQKYFDENAGTQFQDLADAFAAGKAVNNSDRMQGLFSRLVMDPIGRMLLKNSGWASGVLQSPGSPSGSGVILQGFMDNKRKNQDNAIQRRLGSKPGASQ